MKCPRLYLCLAHFHLHRLPPLCQCNNMHRHDHQMIWSTSYHHVTLLVHRSWPHLLFTVASVHRRQVLPKLHHRMVLRFAASTCPSHLQPVHQAKPHLDLHLLVTWLHVMSHLQWAPSSTHVLSLTTSPSHLHHGICCSHTCTCELTPVYLNHHTC